MTTLRNIAIALALTLSTLGIAAPAAHASGPIGGNGICHSHHICPTKVRPVKHHRPRILKPNCHYGVHCLIELGRDI